MHFYSVEIRIYLKHSHIAASPLPSLYEIKTKTESAQCFIKNSFIIRVFRGIDAASAELQ